MSNYNSLKATINANIKTNGNQEITGAVMNSVLNTMVNSLGAGYQYAGVATPSTNPSTPDHKVFFIAATAGTYTHFGGLVLNAGEVAIFKWDSSWHKELTGIVSDATITELNGAIEQLSQKINDISLFVLPVSNYDFSDFIAELYVDKQYFSHDGADVRNLSVKLSTNSQIYIVNYATTSPAKNLWGVSIPISGLQDGTIYELKTNLGTIEGGVPYNTIVGYVVFKNLDSLDSSYAFGGVVVNGNVDAAINLSRSPRIANYLDDQNIVIRTSNINNGAVTNPKIANDAVSTSQIQDDAITPAKVSLGVIYDASPEGYEGDIAEVYVDSAKLTGVLRIDMRCYAGKIYFRSFNAASGGSAVWTCANNITQCENGKVYALVCTTAGGSAALNDICGYVVFKNITHFLATTIGAARNPINLKRATMLYLQPYIEGHLTTDYSIPDGTITSAKLASQAVTFDKLADELKGIEVVLPDKLFAVVGDTLQVFFKSCIRSVNPLKYNVVVKCSKGRQFHRYFEYTPSLSDVGTTTFQIIVKDDNGHELGTKQCDLITINTISSPAATKRVLCVGSSTTANGIWVAEFFRRLTGNGGTPAGKELTNINFVGSMTRDGAGYLGKSGWSWKDFCTEGRPAFRFTIGTTPNVAMGNVYTNNGHSYTIIEIGQDGTILCSTSASTNTPQASGTLTLTSGTGDASVTFTESEQDSQNPFWDYQNNKLTFVPYANTYCGGSIDAIYALIGANGLTPWKTDFSDYYGYIQTFANTLHTEFPNAKLFLCCANLPSMNLMMPGYGASGTGYADTYGILVAINNMRKAYQAFANQNAYKTFVGYVDMTSQFDGDYNYPVTEKDVNTRNSTHTEPFANNTIHAGTPGYYQFADAAFRQFIALYCQ